MRPRGGLATLRATGPVCTSEPRTTVSRSERLSTPDEERDRADRTRPRPAADRSPARPFRRLQKFPDAGRGLRDRTAGAVPFAERSQLAGAAGGATAPRQVGAAGRPLTAQHNRPTEPAQDQRDTRPAQQIEQHHLEHCSLLGHHPRGSGPDHLEPRRCGSASPGRCRPTRSRADPGRACATSVPGNSAPTTGIGAVSARRPWCRCRVSHLRHALPCEFH